MKKEPTSFFLDELDARKMDALQEFKACNLRDMNTGEIVMINDPGNFGLETVLITAHITITAAGSTDSYCVKLEKPAFK
jgi:hypothetical protein